MDYRLRFSSSLGWPQQPASFHGQREAWETNFLLQGFTVEGDGIRLLEPVFNEVDGWEGGPIYTNLQPGSAGDPRVTGVLSGTQVDGSGNRQIVFAGGQAMVALANWARANWPA